MDLEEICRVCLTVPHSSLKSIFTSNSKHKIKYSDMIMECASVNISATDKLPKSICAICEQQAKIAFQFKKKCEVSEQILKSFIEKSFSDTSVNKMKLFEENHSKSDFNDNSSKSRVNNDFESNSNICDDSNSVSSILFEEKDDQTNISSTLEVFADDAKQEIHAEDRPHLCTVCGKAFTLSGNLSIHMRTHTGERPYKCNECNACFAQWSTLRSHQVIHSGERRHICPTCGKAFSRHYALRQHMLLHTGVKNHKCSVCPKRFSDSSRLKRHMVIHTGEKKYLCIMCGKSFNRSSTLTVHKRIHTGEKPYVCTVCGRGFIQQHCLTTHLNTHTVTDYS